MQNRCFNSNMNTEHKYKVSRIFRRIQEGIPDDWFSLNGYYKRIIKKGEL